MKFYDWNSLNRLDEIERLAFFQTNDGFFPVVGAALVGTALAPGLAEVVAGTDSGDLLAEEGLDINNVVKTTVLLADMSLFGGGASGSRGRPEPKW